MKAEWLVATGLLGVTAAGYSQGLWIISSRRPDQNPLRAPDAEIKPWTTPIYQFVAGEIATLAD